MTFVTLATLLTVAVSTAPLADAAGATAAAGGASAVDWVAGILVPSAAVLVSAGIALGLARAERRAAEQDRVGAAAARLIRALSDVARAGPRVPSAVRGPRIVLQADLNEFSVALDAKDADVPKFLAAVLAQAQATGDAAVLAETTTFLVGALEGWVRGAISTRRFTEAMPPGADAVWASSVRLEDWRDVTRTPGRGPV